MRYKRRCDHHRVECLGGTSPFKGFGVVYQIATQEIRDEGAYVFWFVGCFEGWGILVLGILRFFSLLVEFCLNNLLADFFLGGLTSFCSETFSAIFSWRPSVKILNKNIKRSIRVSEKGVWYRCCVDMLDNVKEATWHRLRRLVCVGYESTQRSRTSFTNKRKVFLGDKHENIVASPVTGRGSGCTIPVGGPFWSQSTIDYMVHFFLLKRRSEAQVALVRWADVPSIVGNLASFVCLPATRVYNWPALCLTIWGLRFNLVADFLGVVCYRVLVHKL